MLTRIISKNSKHIRSIIYQQPIKYKNFSFIYKPQVLNLFSTNKGFFPSVNKFNNENNNQTNNRKYKSFDKRRNKSYDNKNSKQVLNKNSEQYWNAVLQKVDKYSYKLINQIKQIEDLYQSNNEKYDPQLEKNIKNKQYDLIKRIQTYLTYDQYGIHADRTIYSLGALNRAILQSPLQILKRFPLRICQFFFPLYLDEKKVLKWMVDKNQQQKDKASQYFSMKDFDKQIIIGLLKSLSSKALMSAEKNLLSKIQLRWIKLILAFTSRYPKNIPNIPQNIVQKDIYFLKQLIAQFNNYISKFKQSPVFVLKTTEIVDYFTQRIAQIYYKRQQSQQDQRNFQIILNGFTLSTYLQIIFLYQFKTLKQASAILELVRIKILRNQNKISTFKRFKFLVYYFPSYLKFNENQNKIDNLKESLIDLGAQLYKQNQEFKHQLQNSNPGYLSIMFKVNFSSFFFKKFMSLQFKIIENFTVLISPSKKISKQGDKKRKSLKQQSSQIFVQKQLIPEIPDFIWELYRISHLKANHVNLLIQAIKKLYPQKYIEKSSIKQQFSQSDKSSQKQQDLDSQIKRSQKNQKLQETIIDNEPTMLMIKTLNKLGISFIKDAKLLGRSVDFYLNEKNIVLQIDGDFHFNLRNSMPTQKTCARNLSLLCGGYKLMIMSLYDFNQYRRKQNVFENLFLQKLKVMEKNEAIYIF